MANPGTAKPRAGYPGAIADAQLGQEFVGTCGRADIPGYGQVFSDVADDDPRAPKDVLDKFRSDDLLGFSKELSKCLSHRIGHPTSARDTDRRRSTVRCDEAEFLELMGHQHRKGYMETVEIRNVGAGLSGTGVQRKPRQRTSRFGLPVLEDQRGAQQAWAKNRMWEKASWTGFSACAIESTNLWPFAQQTISHRSFSRRPRSTSCPSSGLRQTSSIRAYCIARWTCSRKMQKEEIEQERPL